MKSTKEKFNPSDWIKEHHVFYVWWKEHRHSGHCLDRDGKDYWGIYPWVAYSIERYRAEFSSDTKNEVRLNHQPSYTEIERWALEAQQASEQKTNATMMEFREQLGKSIEIMRQNIDAKSKPVIPGFTRKKFRP